MNADVHGDKNPKMGRYWETTMMFLFDGKFSSISLSLSGEFPIVELNLFSLDVLHKADVAKSPPNCIMRAVFPTIPRFKSPSSSLDHLMSNAFRLAITP